ncbi:hypothetical protein KY360_00020 [Candidatus Woesearchaeota archaeon]|nr:hypothetical protein [Candidatus Woesearchaeota archaeon]
MEISVFFILAVVIYGISLYLAHKGKFLKFQSILIAILIAIWLILSQLKNFLAARLIFEDVGLVKALLLQVMDALFFNMVAPLTALLVAIAKKGHKEAPKKRKK